MSQDNILQLPAFVIHQSFTIKGGLLLKGKNKTQLLCFKKDATVKVSKVIGCGLKRIDNLSDDFRFGTCATYNFPEERIFLCFALNNGQKCER